MNTDLLPATLSQIFMALAGAALLATLWQAVSGRRYLRLIDAAAAAGLVYLFGLSAFGWAFVPREALFSVYAALFALLAAVAILRRLRGEDAGAPLGSLLIQQAAIAYIFAPQAHWKPPLSALLALYFLISAVSWLKGSEPAEALKRDDPRPPLIPPRRVRGLREFAAAALAGAFVYVFAMGTGRAPVAAPPAPVAQEDAAPAPAASEETTETAPEAVEAAKSEPQTYRASSGDTLKSIARKLYGKGEKWRALAAANPGLKPTARLKAGQVINLPEPPAK